MPMQNAGLNNFVNRSGLTLQNNHTYYVTVAALNKAGYMAQYEDDFGE